MILKDMLWDYDMGGIPGDSADGYLNVELELETETGDNVFVWFSRNWDYETIRILDTSVFSVAMHMTHYDADLELGMLFIEEHSKEYYEYDPLDFELSVVGNSRYLEGILFGRKSLNRFWDLDESEREQLRQSIRGKRITEDLLF